MEHTGLKQYQIASQVFNISDKNLSNKISRNTIDFDKLLEWAVHENVDINWLITGIAKSSNLDINTSLLELIISSIEEGLARLKRKATPEKKAGIIAFLYDRYSKTNEMVDKETIIEHLRLVA